MEKFDMAKFLADAGVSAARDCREQIEYIRLDLIDGDPNNFYRLSGIEDLAANIALCGLQQPVLVREKPEGRYVTVSGHRRLAALALLAEDDPERWQEIPCIVDRDTISPALQQLRLIYANANTRTMSSAELGEQAAQVEKLLYQLKEEGYEFPGRMRDHVAQACQISTSKLARLKVIRSNLIPQFMRLWEEGNLREAVAYTLAGQTPERQKRVWFAQTGNGKKTFPCTDGWLESIFRQMDNIEETCKAMNCKITHTPSCDHMYTRLYRAAELKQYCALDCRSCCISCYNLANCKFSCENAADAKYVLKEKARAEKRDAERGKREKEQSVIDYIQGVYGRVGRARQERGVSVKDLYEAQSVCYVITDDEKQINLEAGNAKIGTCTTLPFGYSFGFEHAKKLCAVADLLGCSTDYLLGREASVSNMDTKPAEQNVSNSDTWRTGEPPEPGEYVVFYEDSLPPGIELESQTDVWTGSKWKYISPSSSVKVVAWTYLPTVSQSTLNNGCITGMSLSGQCGAAASCNSDVDCCLQCDQECNGRCGWIEKEENNAKMQ